MTLSNLSKAGKQKQYIIAIAIMNLISSPDPPQLQDYIQPNFEKADSDSHILEEGGQERGEAMLGEVEEPLDEDDQMFIKKLDVVEALNMIKDITDKEIKEAMFDIDNDKAPGQMEFFQTGKLLKEMNATIISLIPKLDTPNKVSDFRPIACCNVLYKCISKVLTNRIKSGLEKVEKWPKCGLNIDLQKAHDTIMTCISTSAFSISVNGQIYRYFKGAKGLRHNDPISSYLFILVMEVLSLIMIKNIKADGRFKYHAGCKDLQLTHIFCNRDVQSIYVVKKSLNDFSKVSGLFPNLKKSTIFFGSINDQVKQEILKIVAFSIGRYLGVPLLAKCLSVNDCRQLIDKVKERIEDWKNRFLSYAGRLQLIAYVFTSMQTYWVSVYLIPKPVVKEIDKVMKNFLWSHRVAMMGRLRLPGKWFDRWKWPSEWLDMFPLLKEIQVPSLNDSSDKTAWISKTMQQKDFSVKEAWKSVRTEYPKEKKEVFIRILMEVFGGFGEADDEQ
nr:hypothetical protein [Tanacetum cinerariifolium]